MELLRKHERIHEEIAVCFGNFDGVHHGHQALINDMMKYCRKNKYKSMVYTFANHPMEIIAPARNFHYIQHVGQKAESLRDLGVDYLCLKTFDEETMNLRPKPFLDELIYYFKIKAIFVGFNYKFAKNGEGSIAFLKEYGEKHNIEIFIEESFCELGERVSSTRIRGLIHEGEIEQANALLSRPYSIIGTVKAGAKVGRTLGFPTANIEPIEKYILPKRGVYHTKVRWQQKIYESITNVGYNPTFEDRGFSIETHIMDFDNNLYDEEIEVLFFNFLRDEKKFNSKEELIEQIENDINQVLKCKSKYDKI